MTLVPPLLSAIVTGHSAGLGSAIAEHLLVRGARVLGIARRTNDDLAERFSRLEQLGLDLADPRALEPWPIDRFLAAAERSLLVNNAGALQPIGPLEMQDPETVSRTVMLNVGAALTMSAVFASATRNAADRRILHVSSGAGRKPYAGWSVYCATKAALDHHARCVALDRSRNLLISSVAPGVIDTAMQSEIRDSTDDRFPDRPRFVAMHRDHALPGPADVARKLVDYLLSETFGSQPVFDLRDA
jgi:benzil reductase ((S)-benzoin forming)